MRSGDLDGCSRVSSTSFLLLSAAAFLGMVVAAILSWQLPHLFHQILAGFIVRARGLRWF